MPMFVRTSMRFDANGVCPACLFSLFVPSLSTLVRTNRRARRRIQFLRNFIGVRTWRNRVDASVIRRHHHSQVAALEQMTISYIKRRDFICFGQSRVIEYRLDEVFDITTERKHGLAYMN